MQYVMDEGNWKARRSHNFFAFDWVMRADNSFAENLKVHDNYLCVDADDRKCNLQPHQSAYFCPGESETGGDWKTRIPDDLTEKQLVTTHSKDGIAEAGGTFTYFNKGQTLATCDRTRVIPSFLAPNDPTSWGLLSTHEPAHLIVFIGAIFSVAALTELVLLEHNEDSETMKQYFKSATVEGYSIILVLVLFIFRMTTPSVLSFHGENYVRALANSSFLYGVLHYVFWCFYCSYRIRDVKHNAGYGVSAKMDYDDKQPYEKADDKKRLEMMGITDKPPEWNLGAFTSKVPVKTAGLQDVTRLKSSDRPNRGLYLFHMPVPPAWAALQVVVLPLWILTVWTGTRGYSLDVNVQGLYVLTLIFGLLDAYGEPVMTSLRAIESYWKDNNMDNAGATGKKIHNFGPLSVVYFIIMFIQLFIFIGVLHIFDLSNSYHNITGDHDHYRQFFSSTFGFWPFFAYFIALFVAKAFKYYRYGEKTAVPGKKTGFFKNTGEIIFILFVLIVYFFSIIYLANTHNEANLLIGTHSLGDSKHAQIGPALRSVALQWSNAWIPVS